MLICLYAYMYLEIFLKKFGFQETSENRSIAEQPSLI